MKSKLVIINILIFFCVDTSFGQRSTVLTGTFGIAFGSTKANVKEVMQKQKATIDEDTESVITYEQVQLGSQNSEILGYKFVDNKLFEVYALFFPEDEDLVQGVFDELKNILDKKYDKGEYIRDFSERYKDGDGYEMQAIRTGNAEIVAYWVGFPYSSIITLEILYDYDLVYVRLIYQDGRLIKEAIKERQVIENEAF